MDRRPNSWQFSGTFAGGMWEQVQRVLVSQLPEVNGRLRRMFHVEHSHSRASVGTPHAKGRGVSGD